MTILIITRGLPGSGKTTFAQGWVDTDPDNRARVNRDEIRAMLGIGITRPWSQDTEEHVKIVRDASISELLRRGVSVVCDDTNLPSGTVRHLRRLAELAQADFDIEDLTNVDFSICLERDAARGERQVGPQVIRDFFTRYIEGKPYPLPVGEDPEDVGVLKPYVPVPGSIPAIIVDIDGTVALRGTRSPFDQTRVHEDLPNEAVIHAIVSAANAGGMDILFVSGRTVHCEEATNAWIHQHFPIRICDLTYRLFMRAAKDGRRDSVVKAEIFDQHIRDHYDVKMVFDDRNQVVEMWRSLGLTVLQVADGNF